MRLLFSFLSRVFCAVVLPRSFLPVVPRLALVLYRFLLVPRHIVLFTAPFSSSASFLLRRFLLVPYYLLHSLSFVASYLRCVDYCLSFPASAASFTVCTKSFTACAVPFTACPVSLPAFAASFTPCRPESFASFEPLFRFRFYLVF